MCILVVDAERGFESQDQRIFHIADRNHKGIVILVNKWDLIKKSTETSKKFIEEIKKNIMLQMFLFYLFLQEKNKDY